MSSLNVGPGATNPVANSYVRELGYVADVNHGDGLVQATFKAPPASGGAVVIGQPQSVGVATLAEWGQNVVASAAGDVHGYDYLGQPMIETFGAGGAGAKAFMWVTKVTNAITLTWGLEYGLPYAAKSALTDTLTVADQTTPSATTGDPRGTVLFDTPADGATDYIFTYTPYRTDVDAGFVTMHGLRHYYPPSP